MLEPTQHVDTSGQGHHPTFYADDRNVSRGGESKDKFQKRYIIFYIKT